MNTSRYVYNNCVKELETNKEISPFGLRDKFVTATAKGVKNELVKEWELDTPKDVRAGAIRDLVKARKTAFTNLKNGIF
jgi:hypothetical protein